MLKFGFLIAGAVVGAVVASNALNKAHDTKIKALEGQLAQTLERLALVEAELAERKKKFTFADVDYEPVKVTTDELQRVQEYRAKQRELGLMDADSEYDYAGIEIIEGEIA